MLNPADRLMVAGFKAEVHARALTFYTSKKFIKLLPGSAAGQGYAPEACSGEFVEARVPEVSE